MKSVIDSALLLFRSCNHSGRFHWMTQMNEGVSMKYIFVTGGVVSSLGKGLTAGALVALLEQCGLCVRLQKFTLPKT